VAFLVWLFTHNAQGIAKYPNPSKLGGETVLRIEQMENGYYLLTYKANGITLQRVFCEPSEKVKVEDLKPLENPDFELMLE